jgi:predicted transglutaminase-like cysteine proteinase
MTDSLLLGALFYASLLLADSFGLNQKMLGMVAEQYGANAKQRLLQWEGLGAQAAALDDSAKLALVNTFFNRLPNVDDIDHWGRNDYWATPVELLASNGGDCEDFAIAKYFTLRYLGVAPERLRITYVKAFLRARGLIQAHMVLAYYATPDAEPLILDNTIAEIRPATARGDLVPVYSFNGDGLWLAKERNRGRPLENSGAARLWLDLMQRMQQADASGIAAVR